MRAASLPPEPRSDPPSRRGIVIVVPCYNESQRLNGPEFLRLARHEATRLIFVDDGSTDRTPAVLRDLAARAPDAIEMLALACNAGKAEAVRQGLLHGVDRRAAIVGYVDADLATPVDEVMRLIRRLEETSAAALIGARVRLLGRQIERRPLRHYLGRVFATTASVILGLPVYDTQCGAKFFRTTDALAAALATPFRTRWIFDVELLQRLTLGSSGVAPLEATDFIEEPLVTWQDVAGSKLTLREMTRALLDLAYLARQRRRRPPPVAAPAPRALSEPTVLTGGARPDEGADLGPRVSRL